LTGWQIPVILNQRRIDMKSVYIVYHFYKNQACGFRAEKVFENHTDALDYIRRDPNIGCEKEFNLGGQYAIEVVDFVDVELAKLLKK
jgi:hypothetical protein